MNFFELMTLLTLCIICCLTTYKYVTIEWEEWKEWNETNKKIQILRQTAQERQEIIEKININLNYISANESSRNNIHFVYESVAEWAFNELKPYENRFHHFDNIINDFHVFLFNMKNYYESAATDVFFGGGKIEESANEFLIRRLHFLMDNMAKRIENVSNKKCEVPEELIQKINSLFWSL